MKILLEKHEQECLNKTIHDATDEHHHEEEEDLKVGENGSETLHSIFVDG